jgi:hypothetical protein
LRQVATDKQPFRCHACGVRPWRALRIHADGSDVRPEDLRTGRASEPVSAADLDQLDSTPTA